jgi:antitoxin FitA
LQSLQASPTGLIILACKGLNILASITVRNIDDSVKQALRVQAAEYGLSMEERVRQLITEASTARKAGRLDLALEFSRRFGPLGGIDLLSTRMTPAALAIAIAALDGDAEP